jgi:hypothetical protein
MSLNRIVLALSLALAMVAGAFAAETTVSGRVFVKAGVTGLNTADAAGQTSSVSGVALDRTYLTIKSKIDDVWSVNVTLDGIGGDGYGVFVKTAFVTAKLSDMVKISAGIIGQGEYAPIDGWNDMRWTDKPLLDAAGDYLGGKTFGSQSADMGISADFSIAKMLKLTVQWNAADGYKTFSSFQDLDSEITVNAELTIEKAIKIDVFGNFFLGPDAGLGLGDMYFGAAVGYITKPVKVGVVWIGSVNEGVFGAGKMAMLMEVFANLNFSNVLVLARARMGVNDTALKLGVEAGVGYQFNKNVRVALMYNLRGDDGKGLDLAPTADTASEHNIFVAADFKF